MIATLYTYDYGAIVLYIVAIMKARDSLFL